MRKRININAVCSSDNYAASRRAHIKALAVSQRDRLEAISQMTTESASSSITIHCNYQVVVFGHNVIMSSSEAMKAKELGFTILPII